MARSVLAGSPQFTLPCLQIARALSPEPRPQFSLFATLSLNWAILLVSKVYLGSKAVCSVPWFWHCICPSSFHPSRGKKTQTHCSRGACFIFKHSGCKDLTAFRWEAHLFSYAVPGARLLTYEVNLAICRGLRLSRQPRVAGPLLEEVQHWTFLRSWHGCLPWLKESHTQIQLASDASSFAWGGVRGPYTEPVSIRDYWPLLDLGHNIAAKATLALVNVLEAFSRSVQDHRVDVFTDSQALIRS